VESYRGSEWRRWDLHLHTPNTVRNDEFVGTTTEEKWSKFYETINNYVSNSNDPCKNICAIAITDYLSIENYLKVLKDSKLPECVKLIIPNVELRMQPVAANSPINLHCLFNPSFVNELESRFFSKLSFSYADLSYGATKAELIRLGKKVHGNNSITEEDAYRKGNSQFVLTLDSIEKVFRQDKELRENTLIAVSNSSNDGASGLKEHHEYIVDSQSQLEATRQGIYKFADFIFSAKPKDIDFFLGKGVDCEIEVIRKCGSLKPCIHGSDAHKNSMIFEPDQKRYCWIKADPTFEGLKQVLFEPFGRVKISSTLPEPKSDYYVIDHVIVNHAKFDNKPIYLNDKLNCIIGGKSTGKSLLLQNIANVIDSQQVKNKAGDIAKNVNGFSVVWRDNLIEELPASKRKIVYIPQTYINRLTDSSQDKTEIDAIIEDILLKEENFKRKHDELLSNIHETKVNITNKILHYLTSHTEIARIEDVVSELGGKNETSRNLKTLEAKLKKNSKEVNVPDDIIEQYNQKTNDLSKLNTEIEILDKDFRILSGIETVLSPITLHNIKLIRYEKDFLSSIKIVQSEADNIWQREKKALLNKLDEQRRIYIEEKDLLTLELEILKPKVLLNEEVVALSKAVNLEKVKIDKIEALEKDISKLKTDVSEKLNCICGSLKIILGFYNEYANFLNEKIELQINHFDDMKFTVQIVFKLEAFNEKLAEMLNNKTINRVVEFPYPFSDFSQLNETTLRTFVSSLQKNDKNSLQLKKSFSVEDAMREIFNDWVNIDYSVQYESDSLKEMSPGKKALVILRLLIAIAESQCPILLDQPEDDLDNRSIYDELSEFIKEKKVNRQIILVTHNANIVLGGDAELVIVANQNGANSPNEKFQFEYRAGAIENNTTITFGNNGTPSILNSKGIQTHICEILEGGERAFEKRRNKYRFMKND
jgi:ABC-type branched-subunit amino acid transport system ATPase component